MDFNIILASINLICILVLIIVAAFLYIEYNRLKNTEKEIIYYLNKNSQASMPPVTLPMAPPTPVGQAPISTATIQAPSTPIGQAPISTATVQAPPAPTLPA
jgi:hypothetical protein